MAPPVTEGPLQKKSGLAISLRRGPAPNKFEDK